MDTVDENENETAGRGMIANREIKEGDELFTLPIDLLLTKTAARKVRADSSVGAGLAYFFPCVWFRMGQLFPVGAPRLCSAHADIVGPALFFNSCCRRKG